MNFAEYVATSSSLTVPGAYQQIHRDPLQQLCCSCAGNLLAVIAGALSGIHSTAARQWQTQIQRWLLHPRVLMEDQFAWWAETAKEWQSIINVWSTGTLSQYVLLELCLVQHCKVAENKMKVVIVSDCLEWIPHYSVFTASLLQFSICWEWC